MPWVGFTSGVGFVLSVPPDPCWSQSVLEQGVALLLGTLGISNLVTPTQGTAWHSVRRAEFSSAL